MLKNTPVVIHTPARILIATLLLAGGTPIAKCEVRLPGLLSSHMVLQRARPIHIWGWSDPGEKITVELHGVSRATAGSTTGSWSVFLPPEPAGGPFQLTVSAGNRIVLDDVLIGDVWFASGQSNMEMPLKGFTGAPLKNSAEEIANAAQPQLRLIDFPKKAVDFPQRNIDAQWTVCTSGDSRELFGRGVFLWTGLERARARAHRIDRRHLGRHAG